MSDEHVGDVFLRHRAALLDALLSDPALGPSEAATGDARRSDEESVPGATTPDSDPGGVPAPLAAGAAGPKASERILALLNGQTPNEPPAHEFSPALPDYSTRSAEDPEPLSERQDSPGPTRSALTADRVRELLVTVRKPRAALMIGAAVVVVLALAVVIGGGETAPDETGLVTASPNSVAAEHSTTTSAAATATTIVPKSAQAQCPPGGAPASDVFAGTGRAWSCARSYRVDGQVLTIDLGRTYRIESIGVVPGWEAPGPDGADQWSKYRTVSRISYRFDDSNATTFTQQTLDQRTLVVTRIDPAVTASKIVLTVLESKGEPNVNSVALSSIVITGQ